MIEKQAKMKETFNMQLKAQQDLYLNLRAQLKLCKENIQRLQGGLYALTEVSIPLPPEVKPEASEKTISDVAAPVPNAG